MNNSYSIYPVPHQIDYRGQAIASPAVISVDANFDLDKGIERRLSEALAIKKIDIAEGADFRLELTVDPAIKSDAVDYHEISIREKAIVLRARDKAGIFYALTTVYHILSQSEDQIQCLEIKDYANLPLRGLIEGYYGIPWSDESRKSIIEFGSYFKMNMYAFAPKDDPYHRDLWWELYPEEPLSVISSLAQFGEACYNHYTWTIAPFKADANPIREANKEEGLALVIAKFEQLYAAGVRQFGVLGDDVGNLPYDTVVYVMNELNQWRKSKPDVGELIFCPEGYNMADWAFKDGSELNNYDANFDRDIHIFFTGMSTCSPASHEAVYNFKNKLAENGHVRRDPLFWMNWPVNDIDRDSYRRIFMGKGEVYEPGITDMTGMLTNPMEEAQASKVALFATLDYAWNTIDFNADQSWLDSFPYIDADAASELHELSKHMSEISNGAKADAEESVELAAKIARFEADYEEAGSDADFTEIKEAYQTIVDAAKQFLAKSKNEQLIKEIRNYINNLSDKSEAALILLAALESANKQGVDEAKALLERSKTHFILTRTAEFPSTELYAQTGAKVIDPHIEDLLARLA